MRNKNKIIILSDVIKYKKNLPKEAIDTFIQVKEVEKALNELGYTTEKVHFSRNLAKLGKILKNKEFKLIFNLVENENNSIYTSLFLEQLNIKFTGANSSLIYFTTNKILIKKLITSFNYEELKSPQYITKDCKEKVKFKNKKFIIKPVSYHASSYITEKNVIEVKDTHELIKKINYFENEYKINFFAEEYIDGREFNVAILNNEILPIQEIIFNNYSPDKPKIVCYNAKWKEDSFEYQNTLRKYDFDANDKELIKKLEKATHDCISLFNINSYTRLDFRAHEDNIFLIDINPNPCLSPDAGFFSACQKKGLTYKDMIKKIIEEVKER